MSLRIPYRGGRPGVTLGSNADGGTRHLAAEKLADTMGALRLGVPLEELFPPEELAAPAPAGEPLIATLIDEYISDRRGAVAGKTLQADEWALRSRTSYVWEGVHLWAYDEVWDNNDMSRTEQVTIGDRGRLVLPSSIRSALGLTPGTRMLLSTEPDGSLRLRPYRAVAEQSRGLFANLTAAGSLVDELVSERRAQAKRDE